MRNKNVNRLVWNNSFSNDKRLHENKEPYKKKCANCKKEIWMTPKSYSGWKSIDNDGKEHNCKKVKKRDEKYKIYERPCFYCKEPIAMKLLKGRYKPFDESGNAHRCKRSKSSSNAVETLKVCACGSKVIKLESSDYVTFINQDDKKRHYCKASYSSLPKLKEGEIPWNQH